MLLIVGGIASGKRTFVRSLGYDVTQLGTDPLGSEPVLVGLEEFLRHGAPDAEALAAVAAKEVVVCCEVGGGVVPLDPDERAWRELVGRTCAELATRACGVVRLVCGIPVWLKGSTAEA